MPPKVLIAYCTRSGSTMEVAEEVGRTMEAAGLAVEVKSMADVQSIADDQAVIMGTALYVGHFAKVFHHFAARFERELSTVRPWIFVLGPTEKNRKHFAMADEQARTELAKCPWIHPADMRVLGGKFDPRNLKLPFLLSVAMKLPGNPMSKAPASDIRDWAWIRSWANAIAENLTAAV
jgi:menaquinone-dependent protoporphyrinogen oxidase